MAAITTINPRSINTTGNYVVDTLNASSNVVAGNVKTDHLLYANGTPYVFTTNASGANTQVQFNDGNSFAGSANLTFNKTSGTLTVAHISGDGANIANVDAKTLNGHNDTYFASTTYVDNAIGNLIASAPAALDTLNELANALGNDASFSSSVTNLLANKANTSDLSTVATSGNYYDLTSLPSLFSGNYQDLTDKPTLFDGEYSSLANTPSLALVATSGNYQDLTNKPSLFDGEYSSLANTPTLFSGSYTDLTNKPTLGTAASTDANAYATAAQGNKADSAIQSGANISVFTNDSGYLVASNLSGYATESYVGNQIANVIDLAPSTLDTLKELANAIGNDASFITTIDNKLANKANTADLSTVATSGNYHDLTSLPTLFSGNYQDLADKPTLFDGEYSSLANAPSLSTVATSGSYTDLTNTPSLFDGEYASLANKPTLFSGSYLDLTNTPTLFSGDYADLTNKPTLGNISSLDLDGNSSNILYGNGSFASAPVTYGDSNVQSYLPNYAGAMTFDVGNLHISNGSNGQVLTTDGAGNLSWSSTAGGSSSYLSATIDTFTGDGTTTEFTLSITPGDISETLVNYNGAMQLRSAYSISGSKITFSEAPANGATIEVTTTTGVTGTSGSFVVRQYTGDGSDTTFDVSSACDETNILVTLNGVLQSPTLDYTVANGVVTFTSAPFNGERIQIRELRAAASVNQSSVTLAGSNTQIQFNDNGNLGASANFAFDSSTKTLSVDKIQVTGDITPTSNVTYDLGNSTHAFRDLYLSGSTIYFGGATIKADANTGAIALIPQPTANVPNPTGIVITTSGTISTVATANGNVTTTDLSNAVANSSTITVGGSDTQIQFNNNGDFGASANLTFDSSTKTLNVDNIKVTGAITPSANITYDLGNSTNRFKDLYLSNNSIHLGDTVFTANSILPFNLAISAEVLTINTDAPFAGNDIRWLFSWNQSTLPYARTTIVNQEQASVPLYKQGVYQINNFANEMHGPMDQRHMINLKWVDGAGLDNTVSWAVSAGNVSFSDANINGGNTTTVQRLNINVPASITVPTLNLPSNVYYNVAATTSNVYSFSGMGVGDNRTIGPLYRGATYTFNLDSSLGDDNKFYLTTDNGTAFVAGQYVGEYTSGVTGSRGNGAASYNTLSFTVPANAPDVLYYQSANVAARHGAIVIKDLAVETNVNGNYVLYFQHMREGHKTPVEIRPIPSMVNQMCLVYDQTVGKFVPQDMATYVENTPSFKNKIREVAGTATLIAPNGVAVVPTVLVVEDTSYLPLVDNKDGDIAFDSYYNTMYVWDTNAWKSTKPNLSSYASTTYVDNSVANLVNSAPAALDTLKELATALGNDASFSTTITNTLANKLDISAFTYANLGGTAPATYANSNVATYLPTYTGNLSPGNLTVGLANLKISGGSANYVIKTDGLGNLSWAAQSGGTMSFVKEYVWRGGLTENVGSLRHYIHTNSTLTGIYAYLVSAGLSQSTVVVKKNGTSINTITIPANTTTVNQSGLSISLSAADYLTVDITQSSSATDLYINFVYQG